MKEAVIDRNYPDLREETHCYRLSGNLSVPGSLNISLEKVLFISGSIKAGRIIRAGVGIEAAGSVEACLTIQCGRSIRFNNGICAGTCTWRKTKPPKRESRPRAAAHEFAQGGDISEFPESLHVREFPKEVRP